MLVYRISPPGSSPPGKSCRKMLSELVSSLSMDCGHRLQVSIGGDRTTVVCSETVTSADEEFFFRFTCDEESIFIANLQVPQSLRRKGMGARCIRWLLDLARDLGFRNVTLESYPSSVGFWELLGFVALCEQEDY